MNVIIGCIPFAIIGVLFYDNIKSLFNLQSVIIGFIVGGILLLVVETLFRKRIIPQII